MIDALDLRSRWAKIAQLPPPEKQHASAAHRAFTALSDAGVISKQLCRRLIRAQDARTTIEHGYLGTTAGNVHQAAQLIRDSAREFIAPYRDWITPYLTGEEYPRG